MPANEKTIALIRVLAEKTRNNEIVWEKTSNPDAFQTSFPNYSIVLLERLGEVTLHLANEKGEVIERYSSTPAPTDIDHMMHETFELARRKALGVDQALDDILKTLDAKKQR
jgi:hypothetical protein